MDENEIWQCVEDKDVAWHIGAQSYRHPEARNANSLGVEMCSRRGVSGVYYFKDETVKRTVALVKELMIKYGISSNNVVRHYDVTGKVCPAPYVDNAAWERFKGFLAEKEVLEKMTRAEFKRMFDAEMTAARFEEMLADARGLYNTVDEVPAAYRAAIEKLMRKGLLVGTGAGLSLNADLCRVLTVIDRAGVFGE